MSNEHNEQDNRDGDKHNEQDNRDGDKHDDHDGDDCSPDVIYVPGDTVFVDVPGETVYVDVPVHGDHDIVNIIEVTETVYVDVPGPTVYETVYVTVTEDGEIVTQLDVLDVGQHNNQVPVTATGGWNIIDTGQHNNQVPTPEAARDLPVEAMGASVIAGAAIWAGLAKFVPAAIAAVTGNGND